MISRYGDIALPSRSSNLTLPDFSLWGVLKSQVFTNKPQKLLESKESIRWEIAGTDIHISQKVMDSMHKRIVNCIEMKVVT